MAIKMKLVVTQRAEASCPSHSRTDIRVRDVTTVVDEPIARGGTNMGPTPTETLLAALLGCTNVITNKIAHANDIHLEGMDIVVESEFDRRGVALEAEVDVPFPSMKLKVALKGNLGSDEVAFLKTELRKYCAISKVIRASGTEIEEEWTVVEPAVG